MADATSALTENVITCCARSTISRIDRSRLRLSSFPDNAKNKKQYAELRQRWGQSQKTFIPQIEAVKPERLHTYHEFHHLEIQIETNFECQLQGYLKSSK